MKKDFPSQINQKAIKQKEERQKIIKEILRDKRPMYLSEIIPLLPFSISKGQLIKTYLNKVGKGLYVAKKR